MKFANLLLFGLVITSCSNPPATSVSRDSVFNKSPEENQRSNLCFQRFDGTSNQDTTFLNLVLNGNKVSGAFNHIPYEKDSRKGTIRGTISGDIIKAIWTFMQEGTKDTLSVEFKLSGNRLVQKTLGIDKNTGRQVLTDTSTFSITLHKTECK